MKIFNKFTTLAFSGVVLISSCSEHKFRIKGEIEGAEKKSVILEKSDFYGRWLPLDSTKTNGKGEFSISFPSPAAPEIYRLSFDGRFIYVPIDSTETINLRTTEAGFGTDFSLSGSDKAVLAEKFEKEILNYSPLDPEADAEFKKGIYANYLKDSQGSIVSYYILTKTVNGKPIFDSNDINDAKYFAAVATGFKSMRPDDPRTAILEQVSLEALKRKNSAQEKYIQIEADEIKLLDMELQNENGENISLSSIAGKGKPVVLIFSLLTHPDSPALNIELARIYNSMNGNVEFYNVSLDPDQYSWRDAAKNIPWITVYAPGQINAPEAAKYNVFALPSFFIINAQGEIASRPESLQDLEKSLR